jgi:hypothetical protein
MMKAEISDAGLLPVRSVHAGRGQRHMKFKVVSDRGELRDYFDPMTIEQRTGRCGSGRTGSPALARSHVTALN